MSYTRNRKFLYLLDNVFSNIHSQIGHQLDLIQSNKENYTIRVYNSKQSTNLRLQYHYPIKSFYNNIKSNSNDDNIKDKNDKINSTKENKLTKQDVSTKVLSNDSIPIIKKNVLIPKLHNQSTIDTIKSNSDTPFNIINSIIEQDKNIICLDFKKTGDYYSIAFFSSLSNIFYLLDDNTRISTLKDIKISILDTFNKENYYSIYDYTAKHFKKSELDDTFSFNKNIKLKMLKVYADILNVNLVYLSDNNTNFFNKFNVNNATVIIGETTLKIYTLYSKNSFIRGITCSKILNIEKKYSSSTLEKYKLEDLQNIARMYNIDIRKKGKNGKVNIKKEELIKILSV